MEHTFAICAYKESPYLEECIKSVQNQTVTSEVILVTSTPNKYIFDLCEKYNISYFINEGESGITQDWNFAYSICKTPVVTITHQDDLYFEKYTENLLKYIHSSKKPLIFFSDYCEIRNGNMVCKNRLLKIKRIMLFPLKFTFLQKRVFIRRFILAFGSPICCPSVAYYRKNLPKVVFQNNFRTNEDWEAWERLSRMKGQFLYCSEILVAHRIHKDSETSNAIKETGRTQEDIEMYKKFWPGWIAGFLSRLYKKSEESNDV